MARSALFLLHFLLVAFLTPSSISTVQLTTAQTDGVELATLLTIKRDWGNPAALSSWNSTTNSTYCVYWEGVRCDADGHVTALSFPNSRIANPIPASVCTLGNLTHIDLSYNNLTGEFPTALYGCSALRYLDLSNNGFSGALPDDIGNLSSSSGTMEHLNLSSNGFTGSVPSGVSSFSRRLKSLVLDTNGFNGSYPSAAISELTELETLTLASNPFSPGPVPREFGKLTKLKTLWMSGMNLTGGIPDTLSSLTELTLLDLSQNRLGGEIPGWVWNHQKLRFLYLYANEFTGGIGPNITADVNKNVLEELDLSVNRLTEPIPDAVGNMKNLKLLYLYFNNITGPIPASVGLLPNLTDLRVFNNMLSGPLPPELGKHSPLGNLEACNNMLSGPVPDTLCFNHKLYDVVLFNNNFSGAFPASLAECDTLNNIMVHDNGFDGEFPERVWSAFPTLTNVMIQNNRFTGVLPGVVSSNISRIEMGNNLFTGPVPSSASGLKSFKAGNNRFSGALPANMAGFANLTDLDLTGNRISGSIPPSILSLRRLTSLNLSNNQISGEIPRAIGLLPVLNVLDVSNNELTGSIPQEFNNLHLSFLNLSSNQLTGEVPASLQSQAYQGAFLRNRGLCTAAAVNLNPNLPRCRAEGHINNQMSTGLTILFSVLAGVTFVGVVGCLIILRQKKHQQDVAVWKMTKFRKIDFTECDVLTRLREEDVIGSGGAGKVYRVHLGGDPGTVVAVKRLWSRGKSDEKLEKDFWSEVKTLGDIRHNNIVSLLCCISSEDTRLLVYEYMENGSLDRWLHTRESSLGAPEPLDWPTRLGIAIDAARGLSYMHHECARPIMHRDVKSSNILLDPAFRAKVADFGLARILVKSGGEPESVSAVGGTFGYIAPEYARCVKVNEKVDVYSFGVVLLELTTGRVATDGGAECCSLVEWAWRRYKAGGPLHDVVDGSMRDRAAFVQDAVAVFVIGVVCTGDDASSRPSMKQVLQQLLRYDDDRTGACLQDVYYDGDDAARAQLPAGGKKGDRDVKSSMDSGRVFWDGDEEDSGSFVAHPV